MFQAIESPLQHLPIKNIEHGYNENNTVEEGMVVDFIPVIQSDISKHIQNC